MNLTVAFGARRFIGRALGGEKWQVEMAHVDIVDADFEDPVHCAGVIDLIDSYASDPIGGGQPLGVDVRERLVPSLRDHPTGLVLLAIAEARPIGIAVCFLGFSTFQARALLNIHDLAVLPEWRGKGVGRSLLSAAESRALERGCCKLTLEVQDDNERALALYERFGFSDLRMGDSGPTRFLTKALA